MCVRKSTSCAVELYMTPVKTRKFEFPCSVGMVQRRNITHLPSSYSSLSFSLYFVLFPLCSLHIYIFLSSPFSFVEFPSFCFLLLSVTICLFLFLLSLSLSLSFWPTWLHLFPPSSAALGLSLIILHQNIFSSLFPALCSSHLDHVILKSEGTAFAVFNEDLFAEEEKRLGAGERQAMSPTAEPGRWMHFD